MKLGQSQSRSHAKINKTEKDQRLQRCGLKGTVRKTQDLECVNSLKRTLPGIKVWPEWKVEAVSVAFTCPEIRPPTSLTGLTRSWRWGVDGWSSCSEVWLWLVVNLSEVKQRPPDESWTPLKLPKRLIPSVTSSPLEGSQRLFKSVTTIFSLAATMYANVCS